ncbi:hypothetical protein [Mesorhizobium onobrychidis]|uniref:Uncharacterized protein n=1 Tax=Mesorhizobium onobrychidis TaxID=2775404 RepID=A0ABY5QXL1_9HYPH|nr:hypothetical protein [Mesorhizobium onobrychidis]UVC15197.1 hypothetical protein IHQ72_32330 [Mesorhizobium onobrychidis]
MAIYLLEAEGKPSLDDHPGALLLSGADGADHFARHVADIPADGDDVASNAAAVRRLLGDSDLAEAWRQGRLSHQRAPPALLEQPQAKATTALLHNPLRPEGSDRLRVLALVGREIGPS